MSELPITVAGGFFYNPETDEVFLHLRDGNTRSDPHKWSFFGGSIEGSESQTECCVREWKEELGLQFDADKLIFLMYIEREQNRRHALFVMYASFNKSDINLTEGADCNWFKLDEASTLDLSEEARTVLTFFRDEFLSH